MRTRYDKIEVMENHVTVCIVYYNTHFSFTSSLLLVITIIYIIPSSASAGVESCLANLAKDQNFL